MTLWREDRRCRKRPVIREGQIAGLDPSAICQLAKLIPLRGMGLPGSSSTPLHPSSLSPAPAGPTHKT